MIIDSNFLGGMIKATDKAIPGASDSDLEVPDTVLPIIETLLPLDVLQNSNVSMQSSFLTEAQINKFNPDAAGLQQICILGRGLWTVQLQVASATLGTNGFFRNSFWSVTLGYQGFAIPLLRMIHLSAVTIHIEKFSNFRFLLRDDATINLGWLAPAAGEYIGVNMQVQATKHL